MSKRYAMAVDTRRCVGCNACVLACKAENGLPGDLRRSWIDTDERGTYPNLSMEIRSTRCAQCSSAPCVTNCPTGASYKGAGGIVLVDRDLCTGCKACIASCPYGARSVHPDGYVDKCTLCVHRLERGQQPACATSCPTNALVAGDILDRHSAISALLESRQWKQMQTEDGTEPNLFFLI